jgi:hypothetical protein
LENYVVVRTDHRETDDIARLVPGMSGCGRYGQAEIADNMFVSSESDRS